MGSIVLLASEKLASEKTDSTNHPLEKLRADATSPDDPAVPDEARQLRSRRLAPVETAKQSGAAKGEALKASRPARSQRLRWTLFALLPIAAAAGAYWYVTGGQIMSTDDAYVEADKVGISTDVSGIVQDVDVRDNEHVSVGQVLYRLDPLQFQIALDNAKANLAQTDLTIEAMKDDYQRMLSDVAAQQAQVELDQVTYNRFANLVTSDTVSRAGYD